MLGHVWPQAWLEGMPRKLSEVKTAGSKDDMPGDDALVSSYMAVYQAVITLFRFLILYRPGLWGSKSAKDGECLPYCWLGTSFSFNEPLVFSRALYIAALVNEPSHTRED